MREAGAAQRAAAASASNPNGYGGTVKTSPQGDMSSTNLGKKMLLSGES